MSIYEFDYVHVLSFLFVILNLFCGTALLKINYRNSWNRITGWMFLLNAIVIFSLTMSKMAVIQVYDDYWCYVYKSINTPIAFLIIYFALIFPQPRLSKKATRLLQLLFFVIVLVFGSLLLFHRKGFQENPFSSVYFDLLYTTAFVICGSLWFGQYIKESDNRIRKQLSILLIGFIFSPIVEAVESIQYLDRNVFSSPTWWLYYLPIFFIFIPFSLYIIIRSIKSFKAGSAYDKGLFWGIILAYIVGFLAIVFYDSMHFVLAMVGFAFVRPICFTYSVLKYQLFDIDIIIKRSTKVFLIVSMIGLVFAGIQELIELVLPFSKIISALVVAAAFIPIEKLAGKITNTIFPWNETSDEYIRERRKEIYVAALEGAYYDAILTQDEEKMLAKLRNQLDIPEDEHLRYAHEAQKSVLPGALGTGEIREKIGRRKTLYYAISITLLFILFVVGQELLENILPMPTIVSAILLSILFIPMRYVLDKRIIKRYKRDREKSDPRSQALSVYEGILRDAWEDRIITDMESDMLRFIRKELGISEGEHREMARRIFV